MHGENRIRRLPRGWRIANQIYLIIITPFAFINGILSILHNIYGIIPPFYFELSSAILCALPVTWSKILDAVKEYQDEEETSNNEHQVSLEPSGNSQND